MRPSEIVTLNHSIGFKLDCHKIYKNKEPTPIKQNKNNYN